MGSCALIPDISLIFCLGLAHLLTSLKYYMSPIMVMLPIGLEVAHAEKGILDHLTLFLSANSLSIVRDTIFNCFKLHLIIFFLS